MKKNPFGAELNPISRLLKSISFLVLLLSLSVSSSAQQANQTQANQTLVDQVHQASTDLRAKIRQNVTLRDDLWPYGKWGDTLWALTLLYENQRLPEVNERLRVHLADSSQTPFNYFDAIDYIKILELFRMESPHFPGRLEYSTEMQMKEALWDWAKKHEDYWDYFRELDNEPMGSVWSVYASENHDLVRRGSNALIFAILAQDPDYSQRTTNNGMTVGEYNQHYTVYLKKWIKERAAAGVWMEVGAAYAKYSWSYLLAWHDLHPDPEVRQLAKMLLDIAFIDSAQLSFSNGFQGGGHSRAPRGNTEQWLGLTKSIKGLMYGETGGHSSHSKVYETSTYQVPEIAVFLRKLGDQQGPFQIKNRVIAETARPDESHPSIGGRGAAHYLKSDSRFINYNHKTPTYSIGGTLQIIDSAADGVGDDSGITRQDRWGGIFFNDENNSRVIPFAESNRNGGTRTHNAFWQVQHKNLMIAQRNKRSAYIHRLMVHVSEGLEQQEEEGWVFTSQGDAYAAVKVLGGYFRDTAPDFYGDQTFIIPHDQYAPIVFFAGSSHDGFSSFMDFKDYVLSDLKIEDQISSNKRIILNRPNEAQLIFHTDYRAPIINDAASPYNATLPLRTDYIYKSPYMNTGANKYQVVVAWENYKKLYDFQTGEIADLSGPNAGSLVHQLKLDETTGTHVDNSAGYGTPGTSYGGLQWKSNDGIVDGAAELDGIDDYIDLGTSGSLAGTTDFTVSAWVKTSSKNQTQYIVQQRGTRSYHGEFMVYVNSHGKASFAVYNGGYQFQMASSSAINDGQWHHIAMIREGTVGKIYIDGQLEKQVTGYSVKALDPSLN
ncbi:MAG: LamG domain-containing protein, partial [Oleispira sp.]|nr:LamG domain-containing protein [Oleispira sp.]